MNERIEMHDHIFFVYHALWDSMAMIIESESSLTRMVNESSLPMVLSTFDMLEKDRTSYYRSIENLKILPNETNAKTHISITSIGFKTFTSHDQ